MFETIHETRNCHIDGQLLYDLTFVRGSLGLATLLLLYKGLLLVGLFPVLFDIAFIVKV